MVEKVNIDSEIVYAANKKSKNRIFIAFFSYPDKCKQKTRNNIATTDFKIYVWDCGSSGGLINILVGAN